MYMFLRHRKFLLPLKNIAISRHYGNTSSSSSRIPPGALPPGTAAPQVVLAAEPVSAHDLNLVSQFVFPTMVQNCAMEQAIVYKQIYISKRKALIYAMVFLSQLCNMGL